MNLQTPLKRAYWAAIIATLLCLAVIGASGPTTTTVQPITIASSSEQNEAVCTTPMKSNWRFATTPLDMPTSLLHKTPSCRA